jgi:hypothetical protein
MAKFILGLIVGLLVGGGAVALTTLYDRPAKAEAAARIDPSEIVMNAQDLPVAHYDDYCVVFRPAE